MRIYVRNISEWEGHAQRYRWEHNRVVYPYLYRRVPPDRIPYSKHRARRLVRDIDEQWAWSVRTRSTRIPWASSYTV